MKTDYMHKPTRSIISLNIHLIEGPIRPNWEIHRVSVLRPHRGKGHASRLLDRVCKDADKHKEVLTLWVAGAVFDNGLTDPQLKRFYERYGFKSMRGNRGKHMVRKPKSNS